MRDFEEHLIAALGWLELESPIEANEELERIEPGMRARTEVLIFRAAIYKKLAKWELLEIVARQLCLRQPDEARWPNLHAHATRLAFSLDRAVGVLMNAVQKFPYEPTIHYNLARYEAQLGQVDSARTRLAEAIKLEPIIAEMALEESDLSALHHELRCHIK